MSFDRSLIVPVRNDTFADIAITDGSQSSKSFVALTTGTDSDEDAIAFTIENLWKVFDSRLAFKYSMYAPNSLTLTQQSGVAFEFYFRIADGKTTDDFNRQTIIIESGYDDNPIMKAFAEKTAAFGCYLGFKVEANNCYYAKADGTADKIAVSLTYPNSTVAPPQAIDNTALGLSFTTPTLGSASGTVASTGTGFTVSPVWSGKTGTNYAVGESPAATVTITPSTGYYFSEAPTAAQIDSVNTTRVSDIALTSGIVTFTYTFPQLTMELTKPVITGTAAIGQTLSLTNGYPTGSVSYQWYLDDTAITDSTASTFLIPDAGAYIGKTLYVVVTPISPYTLAAANRSSAATAAIVAGTQTLTGTVTIDAATPKQLTVTDPTGDKYEYSKDGTTYVTSAVFTGLTCGSSQTLYARLKEVKDGTTVIYTASNAISGTATVAYETLGGTLTLDKTSPKFGDEITASYSVAAATVTYQWYRGTTAITGATAAAYTVTRDDIGQTLKAQAIGTGDYLNSALYSASTAAVPKLDLKVTVDPTVSSVYYGQTLALSTISSGTVTEDITSGALTVEGGFAWAASTVYPVNASTYSAVFTPTNTTWYNSVAKDIAAVVLAGAPVLKASFNPSSVNANADSDTTVTITLTAENQYSALVTDVPTELTVVSIEKFDPESNSLGMVGDPTSKTFTVSSSDLKDTRYVVSVSSGEVTDKYEAASETFTFTVGENDPDKYVKDEISNVSGKVDALLKQTLLDALTTPNQKQIINALQNSIMAVIRANKLSTETAVDLGVKISVVSYVEPIYGRFGSPNGVDGSITLQIALYGINSQGSEYSEILNTYTIIIKTIPYTGTILSGVITWPDQYDLAILIANEQRRVEEAQAEAARKAAEQEALKKAEEAARKAAEEAEKNAVVVKLFTANTDSTTVPYYIGADGSEVIVKLSYHKAGKLIWLGDTATKYYYKDIDVAYGDIDGHWAENYILEISRIGLFLGTGDGNFSPDETMTGGMLVTVLARLDNVSADTTQYDKYYIPYVQWASDNGLLYGLDAFDPEAQISRCDTAVVIANYLEFKGVELTGNAAEFTDEAAIPEYAKLKIDEISGAGIILGRADGSFDPDATLTRAENSTIISRLIPVILSKYN